MKYQMTYFPYIYLNGIDEIKFNGIAVWNFDRMKDRIIKSNKMKLRIEELLKLNLQNRNRPIRNIGIVSINNKYDFCHFSRFEFEKIREFQLILFLVSLARMPNELGHEQITSDNFITATQNFRLESDNNTTSVETGRIIRISDMGKIVFHKPHYVKNRRYVNIDEQLLDVLAIIKKKNKMLFRRIIRSTESIMNSYFNNDYFSDMSRILEISRAFEILFNLPNNNQRKYFKTKIRSLFIDEKNRRRRYKSERVNGFEWELDIKQVMWADRMYTLRNHIIHGETIKLQDYKFQNNSHLFLGIWFFLASVKKIINNFIGDKIFYDTILFDSKKMEFIYEYNMILEIMKKYNVL